MFRTGLTALASAAALLGAPPPATAQSVSGEVCWKFADIDGNLLFESTNSIKVNVPRGPAGQAITGSWVTELGGSDDCRIQVSVPMVGTLQDDVRVDGSKRLFLTGTLQHPICTPTRIIECTIDVLLDSDTLDSAGSTTTEPLFFYDGFAYTFCSYNIGGALYSYVPTLGTPSEGFEFDPVTDPAFLKRVDCSEAFNP